MSLKVIYVDSIELTEKMKNEKDIAYSKPQQAFLMTEEKFVELNNKYGFEKYDTLKSFLECDWESSEIQIPLVFTYEKTIDINLYNGIEIILDAYETFPDKEDIDKLFNSKDWHEFLYNEISIILLEVFLDNLTADIKNKVEVLTNKNKELE